MMDTDLDDDMIDGSEDSIDMFIDAVETIRLDKPENIHTLDAKRRLEIFLEERRLQKELAEDYNYI